MRIALLIAKKELFSFLVSPFSYAIAGLFYLVNGLTFYLFASGPTSEMRGNFDLVTELFFSWWNFWFLAIFIPPLLTMRLLAEEFRLGTIETLMTAPSSDASVVVGKFLAAIGWCFLLWLPTVFFFGIAAQGGASFDWGVVATGYLFALLIYAFFLAVGIFTSTLTDTPILSALLAIVIELLAFFVMLLRYFEFAKGSEVAQKIGDRYSMYQILTEHALKGVIDSAHVMFFVTACGLLLFTATRGLEFRRWR
ncbi:MAG TPA: ABC transporter permease [Planctomycetota bacterium]|nr:ABC transporter permease [Planctomycetota bacterium]